MIILERRGSLREVEVLIMVVKLVCGRQLDTIHALYRSVTFDDFPSDIYWIKVMIGIKIPKNNNSINFQRNYSIVDCLQAENQQWSDASRELPRGPAECVWVLVPHRSWVGHSEGCCWQFQNNALGTFLECYQVWQDVQMLRIVRNKYLPLLHKEDV